MFPTPPNPRRSKMLTGETVVGRLTSPNGTYVANPYPTTSAIGGTGAYGANLPINNSWFGPGGQKERWGVNTASVFSPIPQIAAGVVNAVNPYTRVFKSPTVNRQTGPITLQETLEGFKSNVAGLAGLSRAAPTTDPFTSTASTGAGMSIREARLENVGNIANNFAAGQRPASLSYADAQSIGFDRQSLIQAGYSYNPNVAGGVYVFTGGMSEQQANEQGYTLPSGEQGEKYSPWGGASQAVITQSKEGEGTAGYLQKYSSGRTADYGVRGDKWRTIVTGGVRLTIPDRTGWKTEGKGSGIRRSAEDWRNIMETDIYSRPKGMSVSEWNQRKAEGTPIYGKAESPVQQVAGYGLVNIALRVATG